MMPERPLSHLIHTNIGGAGYRTVESPAGWSREHIDAVAAWLQSLKPESPAGTGYASACFKLENKVWKTVAIVNDRFGTDQHIRQGVLTHALLTPVSATDEEAARQFSLLQVAQRIGQHVEQISAGDSASRLRSYQDACRRQQRVASQPTDLQALRHVVADTLPWLLGAVFAPAGHAVAVAQNPRSALSLPQRLAHASDALPPRLSLAATWGCWVQPHQDLRLVVDRLQADLEPPPLPPSMVEYLNWLRLQVRPEHSGHREHGQRGEPDDLVAVLSNWQINDWDTLGREASASGRASRSMVDTADPGQAIKDPNLQREDMRDFENKQRSVVTPADVAAPAIHGNSRRGVATTPDARFLQAELEAMRRELDRSLSRRFELLEKSLGVPAGTSRPDVGSGGSGATGVPPSSAGHWLHRAERPVVYSLLALLVANLAWQWLRPPEPANPVAHRAGSGASGSTGSIDQSAPAEPDINAGDDGGQDNTGHSDEAPGGTRDRGTGDSNAEDSNARDSGTRDRDATGLAYRGTWLATWNALAEDNQPLLAVWLDKIATLDGIEADQVSQGQRNRFARLSKTLQGGQSITTSDLSLSRQALFEYVIARWVAETSRPEVIKINLELPDITPDLVAGVLTDLAPNPRPTDQRAGAPELQAAVICSWLQQYSGP